MSTLTLVDSNLSGVQQKSNMLGWCVEDQDAVDCNKVVGLVVLCCLVDTGVHHTYKTVVAA